MTPDGIVNDHLWTKLVHCAEKLQKEDIRKP